VYGGKRAIPFSLGRNPSRDIFRRHNKNGFTFLARDPQRFMKKSGENGVGGEMRDGVGSPPPDILWEKVIKKASEEPILRTPRNTKKRQA